MFVNPLKLRNYDSTARFLRDFAALGFKFSTGKGPARSAFTGRLTLCQKDGSLHFNYDHISQSKLRMYCTSLMYTM